MTEHTNDFTVDDLDRTWRASLDNSLPIYFIWLGPLTSIYAMAITVSVFVTIIMLYTGFQAIDPDKIRLVQLFGASRVQTLTKVVLPGSVPTMIATLKVNIGLTLVGVIVGEFQAAKIGLGHLITYGSQIFQIESGHDLDCCARNHLLFVVCCDPGA